jgi:hypothetical protein
MFLAALTPGQCINTANFASQFLAVIPTDVGGNAAQSWRNRPSQINHLSISSFLNLKSRTYPRFA